MGIRREDIDAEYIPVNVLVRPYVLGEKGGPLSITCLDGRVYGVQEVVDKQMQADGMTLYVCLINGHVETLLNFGPLWWAMGSFALPEEKAVG